MPSDMPHLAAVMVCQQDDCLQHGPATVAALRPLVARTPHAVLISTGCVHPYTACPSATTAPGSCGVRLQRCSPDLRPVALPLTSTGTTRSTYRLVQDWLDH